MKITKNKIPSPSPFLELFEFKKVSFFGIFKEEGEGSNIPNFVGKKTFD